MFTTCPAEWLTHTLSVSPRSPNTVAAAISSTLQRKFELPIGRNSTVGFYALFLVPKSTAGLPSLPPTPAPRNLGSGVRHLQEEEARCLAQGGGQSPVARAAWQMRTPASWNPTRWKVPLRQQQ